MIAILTIIILVQKIRESLSFSWMNHNIDNNQPNIHMNLKNKYNINRRDMISDTAIISCIGNTGSSLFLPTTASATATTPTISNIYTGKNYVELPLHSGSDDFGSRIKFPLVSFGLQIYNDEMAYKLTLLALEVGYRNFFASILTGNQRGFAKAIRDSYIPRDDIFICGSVVSNRSNGYLDAKRSTRIGWEKNLENM